MTLINYLTRVHFADGVLEEALHSEMDANGKRRPLILAEQGHLDGDVAERLFSGFPRRSLAAIFPVWSGQATESAIRDAADRYREHDCDLLIAFGSNRAMDLAKVARVAIAYDEPIAALSNEEGGQQRIKAELPDLYSIPGILGFASAISDYTRVKLDSGGQALLSSRHMIPTVTICDPTLTLGASPEDSACAAAGILARSIDAYLSPRYNPPADGLALDAIGRVKNNVAAVLAQDDLAARREMMAGGLNSSLSLQKGLCVVHAVSNAIAAASAARLDPSALGGVMIPHLVAFYGDHANGKGEPIRRSLGLADGADLEEGLRSFMADWPLPGKLSALGVSANELPDAAARAVKDRAIGNGPKRFRQSELETLLARAH